MVEGDSTKLIVCGKPSHSPDPSLRDTSICPSLLRRGIGQERPINTKTQLGVDRFNRKVSGAACPLQLEHSAGYVGEMI